MGRINHDLTKILTKKYANKWVALNPMQTKVVASGDSVAKVVKEAKKKKINEPVVTFVPSEYGYLLP